MGEKRRKRPKLRLVYSAPPPESISAAVWDYSAHMDSFRRGSRAEKYHRQFDNKSDLLMHRVRRAAVYDDHDLRSAVCFVLSHVVAPLCDRGGDPTLILGREILEKVQKWLVANTEGPSGPPKLAG